MINTDKKRKRIGIDARFYGPTGKGLGRYTQEIVDNVIKIDEDNEYVVFLGKDNFDEFTVEGAKAEVKKVLAPVRWYTILEQVLMPFYLLKENLDLVHFPHFNVPIFYPKKFIVTVHDLILTKFPTTRATTLGLTFYKIKNLAYKIVIWLAVHRAKKVLAVSEFTKNDIVNSFKVKPEKIVVTYEGVANLAKGRDSLFTAKLDDSETLFGYNTGSPFILYVGNAYPHKNLEGLVRVFGEMIKNAGKRCPTPYRVLDTLRLVLVGKEDYFYKRIKDYAAGLGLYREGDKESPVVFPGYVPDAEMEILFKKARAYVFPSFYEGFGLPPLEAMAKGCPVASSNKTSLPEVLGDAAIYFNPEDEEEMRQQIEKVISDENLRQELIKKGFEQAKKYSWWECARKTLGVYREALKYA